MSKGGIHMKDIVTELWNEGNKKVYDKIDGWNPDFFGVVTWLIPF